MRYCKRCLYPENHPLHLVFDEEGVCSGCRVHEEKDAPGWEERARKLESILEQYRSNSGRNYDCIIPVSGGRDSYFIVHTIKNVYKMNPLLVSYNHHYNTRRGLRNYAYLKTLFNCDAVEMVVEPGKVKKITRASLSRMGSMYWHVLAGSTVFPVQAAVRFKVPLIIWGHHQGLDQVGMFSHHDEVEMTRKYRKEHDLMGCEAEDLLAGDSALSEFDVLPYVYPHDKELEKTGVRGIYLGNYIRWDSKAQHEKMIDGFGYETTQQQRTFDTYNDVDCHHYSGIHDYIKFLKWGYGKATDHASREIRLKRMTRQEGIELVRRYQDVKPADLPLFLGWLGMSETEFYSHVDKFRDPRVWKKSGSRWELQDSVLAHLSEAEAWPKKESCSFRILPGREPGVKDDQYLLLYKGFVHGQH